MTNPLYSETSEDLSQTARQLEDLIAALQYCEKIAKDLLDRNTAELEKRNQQTVTNPQTNMELIFRGPSYPPKNQRLRTWRS